LSDPQSVTAWVAQQRRPLLHSIGTQGFIGRATEVLLAERELALLSVPLVAREQLRGAITLARAAPFHSGELRTMLTLSQMIAQALAQSRDAR
jgi:GAF domain-containing protein